MQAGIDTVLQTVGFDGMLENADCVFTGEGKLDAQSLRGKVVVGVAKASCPLIFTKNENLTKNAFFRQLKSAFFCIHNIV